jgi:hypothetical protein
MAVTIDSQGIPTNRPKVQLTGGDGNVFAVMGACRRAARATWTTAQWALVREKFLAADSYDAVLQVAMRYFEVT